MAWTDITRAKYERRAERYQSDLTDAEWSLIAPHLLGEPRKWTLREIVDAILYLVRSGCQWRMLPRDLPPRSTVYHWFARWRDDGTWVAVNQALLMLSRETLGREAMMLVRKSKDANARLSSIPRAISSLARSGPPTCRIVTQPP